MLKISNLASEDSAALITNQIELFQGKFVDVRADDEDGLGFACNVEFENSSNAERAAIAINGLMIDSRRIAAEIFTDAQHSFSSIRRTQRTVAYFGASPRLSGKNQPLTSKITLKSLRQIIEQTLDKENGRLSVYSLQEKVPFASLKDGGVPLEQLIEMVGGYEVIAENGIDFIRPIRTTLPKYFTEKTDLLKDFESKVLKLMEKAPNHRMRMSTDLPASFVSEYNVELSSAIAKLALNPSESVFDFLPKTFKLISSKDVIILSRSYYLRILLIVVRKMLAGLEGADDKKFLFNHDTFAEIFYKRFKKPFYVTDFGLCYVEDILDVFQGEEQHVFLVENSFVCLGERMKTFFRNSSKILLNTPSVGTAEFDEKYVTQFGAYSISVLTYTHIKDFFEDFSEDFTTFTAINNYGQGQCNFALAEQKRLAHIERNVIEALSRTVEQTAEVPELDTLYFLQCGQKLHAFLPQIGNCENLRDILPMFKEVRHISNLVYLPAGPFALKMELRVFMTLSIFMKGNRGICAIELEAFHDTLFKSDLIDWELLKSRATLISFQEEIIVPTQRGLNLSRILTVIAQIKCNSFKPAQLQSELPDMDIVGVCSKESEFFQHRQKDIYVHHLGKYYLNQLNKVVEVMKPHRPRTKNRNHRRIAANFDL